MGVTSSYSSHALKFREFIGYLRKRRGNADLRDLSLLPYGCGVEGFSFVNIAAPSVLSGARECRSGQDRVWPPSQIIVWPRMYRDSSEAKGKPPSSGGRTGRQRLPCLCHVK
jgi:hypothetical protein